jgi:predicted dehydrogenase
MSNSPLRVGIIGAGGNTRSRHIPGLQAIEGVTIAGVCNRSRESSQRVADEFGIPKIYDLWTDVVADPDIDAVVIGTWPHLHAPATIAALEAGKHVLCEARMAMNAREAHAMWEASRTRPHLTAQLVPAPFTFSVDRTVHRLLGEGFIGEVLAVEVRAGGSFLDSQAPISWRQDTDLSGYNIMSLGIWYETVLRWIGHSTRVTAMGKTFTKQRRDDNGRLRAVRIPEHIDVISDLECGAQAHFQVSSVTGHAGGTDIWLYGSKGTVRFFDGKLWGGQRSDKDLHEIEIPDADRGTWRVEEEFINAIRGLEPVTHTKFADGVKYMEWTEAVGRSMAENRTINLPLTSF